MPIALQWGDGLTFEALEQFYIYGVPTNPFQIIGANNWQFITYRPFATAMKMDVAVLCEITGGFSFSFYSFKYESFVIVIKHGLPLEQLYFHLCHEIGHIVLGHVGPHNTLYMLGTTEEEALADCFACFLLGLDEPRQNE